MAPQADRAAGDDRLDDPAQRVAGRLGGVDRRDDRRVGLGVERVDRAGVADRQVERERRRRRSRPARGRSRRPSIPSSRSRSLARAPDGHAQGRLAGAGAFEDLADAGLVVDRAGQVDVPAARGGRLGEPFELGVVVDQAERDRGAGGHAVIGARVDDDPVGLERLPLAPAVAPLPPLQLAVDELGVERDARGESLDDRRQGRAVRLAGGQVAEHGVYVHFQGNGLAGQDLVRLDVLLRGSSPPRRRAEAGGGLALSQPVASSQSRTNCLSNDGCGPPGLVARPAASTASCRGSAPRRPGAARRSGRSKPHSNLVSARIRPLRPRRGRRPSA